MDILFLLIVFIVVIVIIINKFGIRYNMFLKKSFVGITFYLLLGNLILNLLFFLQKKNLVPGFILENKRYYIFIQGFICICILFTILKRKYLKKIFSEISKKIIFYGIKLYFISVITVFLVSVAANKNNTEKNFLTDIIKSEKNIAVNILIFMIICLLAPLTEEIIFRVMLLKGLSEKFKKTEVVLIGSLVFALMHMDISNFVYYFLFGIFYSYYYIKYKNIYVTLTAHILNNCIIFVLTSLM